MADQQQRNAAQDIGSAIRKELDRHLIDANDSNAFADYREKAGFNKGLREAGSILSRCFSRGDFAQYAAEQVAAERTRIADGLPQPYTDSDNTSDARERGGDTP